MVLRPIADTWSLIKTEGKETPCLWGLSADNLGSMMCRRGTSGHPPDINIESGHPTKNYYWKTTKGKFQITELASGIHPNQGVDPEHSHACVCNWTYISEGVIIWCDICLYKCSCLHCPDVIFACTDVHVFNFGYISNIEIDIDIRN